MAASMSNKRSENPLILLSSRSVEPVTIRFAPPPPAIAMPTTSSTPPASIRVLPSTSSAPPSSIISLPTSSSTPPPASSQGSSSERPQDQLDASSPSRMRRRRRPQYRHILLRRTKSHPLDRIYDLKSQHYTWMRQLGKQKIKNRQARFKKQLAFETEKLSQQLAFEREKLQLQLAMDEEKLAFKRECFNKTHALQVELLEEKRRLNKALEEYVQRNNVV